eukprot:COSAG01_NODE_2566_length_7447_cov_108.279668_12_plen_222_part_00
MPPPARPCCDRCLSVSSGQGRAWWGRCRSWGSGRGSCHHKCHSLPRYMNRACQLTPNTHAVGWDTHERQLAHTSHWRTRSRIARSGPKPSRSGRGPGTSLSSIRRSEGWRAPHLWTCDPAHPPLKRAQLLLVRNSQVRAPFHGGRSRSTAFLGGGTTTAPWPCTQATSELRAAAAVAACTMVAAGAGAQGQCTVSRWGGGGGGGGAGKNREGRGADRPLWF